MELQEFIHKYRDTDIRSLAFKRMPEGVDAIWVLQQIEGYQLAKKKLPRWAATEGLCYPPRISMEQCSSELTAEYKAQLLQRLRDSVAGSHDGRATLIDFTGGFGVDFSYMAQQCSRAIYIERLQALCDAARHNFPLLSLPDAEVVNATCDEFISEARPVNDDAPLFIYLDPARRDDAGNKVFRIEDCTPNLLTLLPCAAKNLSPSCFIIKLSPMLDITQALRTVKGVCEVHVVSVKGECKEVLLVVRPNGEACEKVAFHCVNLATSQSEFACYGGKKAAQHTDEISIARPFFLEETLEEGGAQAVLLEPNASVLKAGVQDIMASRYGFQKLAPNSNLFVSLSVDNDGMENRDGIPGRLFKIERVSDFNKVNLRKLLHGLKQANLAVRNFPATVAELRKRLKIKDGGSAYLFATTLSDSSHVLILCRKV